MSRFKVGDTVAFADEEVKRVGKVVKITGLFRKGYLIEYKVITKKYLYLAKEKYIYKPLETIKEPVSEKEVPND